MKNTSDHSMQIIDEGNTLSLSVEWPKGMSDPDVLHSMWVNSSTPEVRIEGAARSAGFRPLLRSLRANTSELILSTCKIPLPVTIRSESDIAPGNIKHLTIRETGERILLVTLDIPASDYKVQEATAVVYDVIN